MQTLIRSLWVLVPASVLALAGCGKTMSIKSDLILQPDSRARLELEQKTETIDLHNDSNTQVRIRVLDKKGGVITDLLLNADDRARLDLLTARSIKFNNSSDRRAMVTWVLRNNAAIEYTMDMTVAVGP